MAADSWANLELIETVLRGAVDDYETACVLLRGIGSRGYSRRCRTVAESMGEWKQELFLASTVKSLG